MKSYSTWSVHSGRPRDLFNRPDDRQRRYSCAHGLAFPGVLTEPPDGRSRPTGKSDLAEASRVSKKKTRGAATCPIHDTPLDPNGQACPDCILESITGRAWPSATVILTERL